MSGGRVELGLGTGWYQREHEAFGIPFPPIGERFDRLAEQLEIITGLWRTEPGAEQRFSFAGKHYRVEENHTPPRPAQRPHPPIIVGGTGPEADARHRGPVRRRVQRRPQRRPARELRALRPGLRADRPRPGHGPPLGRAAGGLRDDAGRGDPAGRGDRLGADPPARRDRLAGTGRRPGRASCARPAPTRSTSTSTTSRTWTTSRCSARRSCARWGTIGEPACDATETSAQPAGTITTRAAIARAPHLGWEITELRLDPPRAHEVRVRFHAAGLCHSDHHITEGDALVRLPVVGGHEGAGVVESVGPHVSRVKPGDRVVCSYIPACGKCRPCSTGHQNMCDEGKNAGTGMFADGTFRFHARRRGPRRLLHAGHLLPVRGRVGVGLHQAARRHLVRDRLAGGLRGADGLGFGRVRGRRAGR